ncbi:MAG: hypothetical protein K0R72_492 [Clostridia bacterium]|jgi:hypothetical protein|nr:hypothetical protein [Clostridia bacterium]
MDNAQKAIMIGVGLFITIIVIAAVMAITGIGTDLLNQGQSQLGGLSAQISQQLTAEYDDVQMSGAQVLAAVQKYYNDPQMVVAVYNVSGSYGTPVWATPNLTTISPNPTVAQVTPIIATAPVSGNAARVALNQFSSSAASAANRVVTTAQYQAKLVQYNGVTIGMAFLRK